ncbi:MAG: hypothetical protein MUP49_01635 [Dehalococcoidia bacterium]|nr:hypothetical protein [Dehalococcoidia bacterium]
MVLITEDFVMLAEMEARNRGIPRLPYIVFPRTINSLPPEEIEAITNEKAINIIALLQGEFGT